MLRLVFVVSAMLDLWLLVGLVVAMIFGRLVDPDVHYPSNRPVGVGPLPERR